MPATTRGTPGYPGLRLESYGDRQERKPEDLIYHAVRRMLPKNKLAYQMIKKLKIYAGPDHPHSAQQPQPLQRTSKKVIVTAIAFTVDRRHIRQTIATTTI